MPSIPLHTTPSHKSDNPAGSPFPSFLSTPSGLAILEIQGNIHAPFPAPSHDSRDSLPTQTSVGHLIFPGYDPATPEDIRWMKKVHFYVGEHQRLVGEVKRLSKPIAVLRKRGIGETEEETNMRRDDGERLDQEALEILEVVRYKIIFGARPEPV